MKPLGHKSPRDHIWEWVQGLEAADSDVLWAREWVERGCLNDLDGMYDAEQLSKAAIKRHKKALLDKEEPLRHNCHVRKLDEVQSPEITHIKTLLHQVDEVLDWIEMQPHCTRADRFRNASAFIAEMFDEEQLTEPAKNLLEKYIMEGKHEV